MNVRAWGFRIGKTQVLLSGLFLGVALLSWLALASGRGWQSAPAVLCIATAAAAGGYLYRAAAPRRRPRALLMLAGYFVANSVTSGFDVARRALGRRVRLNPVLLEFNSRLQRESARILLANLVNLQPGTLCCRLVGSTLVVHVLDRGQPVDAALRRLEERIGAALD